MGLVTMGDKLLSRGGKLLLASILLNTVPIGYMNVVPLVYLTEIGYDPSVIGVIYAVSALSNAVGLIPMGFLADRYGRKWFIVVGSLIPCLSYAIFGLTLDSAWLIFASALGGVGFAGGFAYAMGNPAIIPLLARSTSEGNRTTLFGLSQGIFTLGLSIGALLSVVPAWLIRILGESSSAAHSASYFLMSGIVVASVLPLLFFVERRDTSPISVPGTVASAVVDAPRRMRAGLRVSSWSVMAKLSAIFALTGLGLGTLVQLLPTWYALNFGVSEDTVGAWTALANGASLIIIPIIPVLVRRRGTLASSAATGLAAAAFLALMPIVGTFEGAAGLFVLRSVLEAMSWAILLSYTMGIVPELERATATGITFTAWGVGATLGTYAGGLFLGDGLLTLPFVLGVASYVAASLALLAFFRGSKPPEELLVLGISREIGRATDK
ncbi:MAG: MFS transporter [Thaumarchaeota archaeon]|nr:MFS transporter [Nitrososphaerota archaeon]